MNQFPSLQKVKVNDPDAVQDDEDVEAKEDGPGIDGKSDTSSIATDSAIGRSSIITGTTAKETQYSEVSRIIDNKEGGGVGTVHIAL